MLARTFTSAILAAALAGQHVVSAQSINTTYVNGLVNALNGLNLTSLVGALTKIQNTTAGQTLLSTLSANNASYTVFAPFNDAFTGVNPFFANDNTWLGQALAYHVAPGTISLDSVRTAPNTIVYGTLLKDPSLVKLGGLGQSVVLSKVGNTTQIVNQNSPVVIVGQATYENLQLYVISAVLDLPPSATDLLTDPAVGLNVSQQLTSLDKTLASFPASLTQLVLSLEKLTIFAPIDSAFAEAVQANRIPSDNATLEVLIANHVIAGELVYTGSPQKNYTSAAGETITVGTGGLSDGSGSVVYYKGELVADIVHGDIVMQSGVVHLINRVLPHTAGQVPGIKRRRALLPPVVNSRLFGRRIARLSREN